MSDTAGANAAATLSLEINTASALANLKALNAEYMSLHANMSKKLDTNIGKEIGQSVKGLQSSLVAVSSGILSINKALDDIVAAGGKAFGSIAKEAKGLSTKLASGGGSIAGTFVLDENQVKKFNERLKAIGYESVKALESGFTTSSFSKANQVITAFSKNTEVELNKVIRMSQEAKRMLEVYGVETATNVYGKDFVSGRYEADAKARLANLRAVKDEAAAAAALLDSERKFDKEVTALYKQRAELQQRIDVEEAKARVKARADLHKQLVAEELKYEKELTALRAKEAAARRAEEAKYEAAIIAERTRVSSPAMNRIVDQANLENARRNVNSRSIAYAADYAAELKASENLEALKKKARDQLRIDSEGAARDALAAAARETEELRKQRELRRLNESGAEASALAKNLAIQERITRELKEQAQWAALSEKQKAAATLKAARVLYSGGADAQAQLPGIAGGTSALRAAQAAGSVLGAETAYNSLANSHKNLSASTNQSAEAQVHWNKVANEGHAAARGLAGGLGALWLTYGSVIPLLAGAAVGAALKSVVTTGKELEYQFTYIKAIADGAVISFNEFKQAMSGSLFDPTEAASGLRILTQAGLSAADAMKSLPEVLKLAAVGEVDLAHAAQSATAIMHTFSLTVNDMGHIGDVFATAARLSATSVGEMMEAMKQASSVADIFGVTMEETAAALATLANRGIEGSAAGTAIRNMVKELSSPATKKAAYAMQQYGIQIFNADGSTKKFTENLKQLSEVTSVMTDKAKARFLEDLFNERGAKAANILLSDMEKMNKILKEIEMSSKGLGFMTEAQIQISQSTEGIAKQLVASTKLVYAEVFASIKPQIDDILTSIGTLVKSSGFKEFMNSLALAVANFTVFLKDHASTIGAVIAAYAAFKAVGGIGVVISTLATKFVALQEAMLAVEVASKAATGATIASGTAMAGTSALIGKLGLLLSGTLVVGLAAAGAAWLAVTLKTREYDSTLVALTKATEDSVVSQKRLNDALEAGLSALVKSNDLQAERIRLLREGKSAADAAAGAMDNLGYASAKSAETQAVSALRVAKEKLNSEEFKGQDINFNPSPAFVEAFDNVQKLTKAAKDSQIELERAASNSVKAGMEGRRKEAQDIAEKAFAEVEVQNKKFEAIAKRGKLAKLELEEGKFYGSQEVQDARKATLKKDIERAEAAARFSPIDSKTAESDSTKVELARREAFLSENSLAYERKPKAAAAAAAAKPNKDLRKTLDENLSSAIKQEQIQLAEELVDIEIELAGQTINSVIATEKKNAAIKASLEIERLLIEASIEDAIVAKDALQITKFQNDLDENSAKLKKQEKAAILDVTKARIADKVAIEDMGVVTYRYIDDLRFEREALDLTEKQVASLRVERERLREQENLSIKVARNQITPDQAAAEAEAINARAEAKRADEEFQQSYVAGWKKAYKAYADAATSETKRAADTFTTLTNAMESALDQFLTTGKLNFAEFAKSVIFELTKIEAKALIAKAAGAVGGGGGGLAGIVGNILGMLGGGSFGTSGTTNSFMTNGVALRSAKGNVFDMKGNLVNTFATGGIVDRPTLFAFAKGGIPAKGLAGEAGPEAILPVARDSAGRLGVRSTGVGGDNISVTINLPPGATAPDIRRATGDLARELTAAVGRSRRYA